MRKMRDLLTHFSATNNKKTNKQTIEYCQEAWKKLFVLHTDSCGWRCCVLDSLTLSPLCAIVKIHTHMPGGFSGEIFLTRQFHSVTILKRTQCVYCILPHNSMKNGLIFVYSPQMKIHQNRFRNRSRKRALILNL